VLKIVYSRDGKAFGDTESSEVVRNIVSVYNPKVNTVVNVSTAMVVDAIRLEVKKGNLKPEEVQFFNGEIGDDIEAIRVDKYGNLDEWPKGFCDAATEYAI